MKVSPNSTIPTFPIYGREPARDNALICLLWEGRVFDCEIGPPTASGDRPDYEHAVSSLASDGFRLRPVLKDQLPEDAPEGAQEANVLVSPFGVGLAAREWYTDMLVGGGPGAAWIAAFEEDVRRRIERGAARRRAQKRVKEVAQNVRALGN